MRGVGAGIEAEEMTLDKEKYRLGEHNGMVAFEEIIGHYYVKVR